MRSCVVWHVKGYRMRNRAKRSKPRHWNMKRIFILSTLSRPSVGIVAGTSLQRKQKVGGNRWRVDVVSQLEADELLRLEEAIQPACTT